MADYNSTSTVTLQINGRQAQQVLADLDKRAKKLEQQVAAAATAGDKASMKKFQRELASTRRLMDQMRGSAASTERTLQMLDRATPKQLNSALRDLKRQLNNIERGTAAWDAHTAKIRQVKAELDRVNAATREQATLWQRMKGGVGAFAGAVAGAVASVAGLVAATRQAVEAYAGMDKEMAGVRKYTGMTQEDVDALNEEFKKMDTRTSREQLNLLAQEAGRLGKTTKEDVLGFVRAADQINVALDDLGEGATLTLSKLTAVFGDEARLGTERSLLAVGSVINELSQNCAASAPYLAEFASRLGGVGSQADMTVDQILAFGAVLDSSAQPLEKSATALSQFITHLYQAPAKYAKTAGLDVKEFSALVRTDMNAAIIELLEALDKAGKMDTLAPMFADLGEKGSGAVTTLSTLAAHISELKEQQRAANTAFSEAVSVTDEAALANSTVEASLEKAKNRTHELWVELGQRLLPVQRAVTASTNALLAAVSETVSFISRNVVTVVTLTAAIAAWTVALNYNIVATKAKLLWSKALTVAAAAKKIVVMALAAGYNVLTGNINRATAAMRTLNASMKTNIYGVIATVVAILISKFIDYKMRADDATEANREWERSLTDISRKSAEYAQKETARLNLLYKAAIDEAKSKDERRKAAEGLIKQYPDYFGKMQAEEIMVGRAKNAYDKLTASIVKSANARAASDKIAELGGQILDEKETLAKEEDALRRAKAVVLQARMDLNKAMMSEGGAMNEDGTYENSGGGPKAFAARARLEEALAAYEQQRKEVEKAKGRITTIEKKQGQLAEEYKLNVDAVIAGEADVTPPPSAPYVSEKETEEERKKREAEERRARIKEKQEFKADMDEQKKAWEERDAADIASRAAGEISWQEFLRKKYESEIQYFDDRAAVYKKYNLEEDEDYAELLKKKAGLEADWLAQQSARTVEQARREQKDDEYRANLAFYSKAAPTAADEEALQVELHAIRVKYLDQMAKAYADGSKERHDYELQLQEAEDAEKLRLQKSLQSKVAQFRQEFLRADLQTQLEAELAMLEKLKEAKLVTEEEYLRILSKLRKKYAKQKAETDQAEKSEKKEEDPAVKAARAAGSQQLNMLLDLRTAWANFYRSLRKEGKFSWENFADMARGAFAVVSGLMQQATEYSAACAEYETAKVEKKYEKQLEAAKGNDKKTAKLEKQKQKEIAKIKTEAAKKEYAMKVADTIATTAINAVKAYGSAQTLPFPLSKIMGALAAGLAVAQGAVQLAVIKKQQQTAETTGYAEGGFTPRGPKYRPAGVVHAGEWVAPRSLVENPAARPLIDALEYARRTNTVGSLKWVAADDRGRGRPAPSSNRDSAFRAPASSRLSAPDSPPSALRSPLAETLARLTRRLDQPFVTVNTVSGDLGSARAQEEYARLIRNKSPRRQQ